MSEPVDSFRLVRREAAREPAAARSLLAQREVAHLITSHEESAQDYVLDPDLETAVNMALAVGEPLLVTGGPGTGKTQLAYYLGRYFDIPVRQFNVKSTSTARDLKWEFDAVGYLQSAYAAARPGDGRDPDARPKARRDFLEKGPLWLAFEDPHPSVILIDEIDKAPRDFPNDLLHELDQGWFEHPFDRGDNDEPIRIPARPKDGSASGSKRRPPIVVITSNVERQLPAPFLRRCVFHHIELTEELVKTAVAARVTRGRFPKLDTEVRQKAIDRFWELRDPGRNLQKPPATGELLVWLAILNAQGTKVAELEVPLADLPARGALVKDYEDLEKLRS